MVGVQGAHPWLRRKALLGSIAGITRDRVHELQNPQPNQPLAAHFRVSSHCLTYYFYTFLQFCYAFLAHVDTRWHLGVFPRSNKEAWEHASLSWKPCWMGCCQIQPLLQFSWWICFRTGTTAQQEKTNVFKTMFANVYHVNLSSPLPDLLSGPKHAGNCSASTCWAPEPTWM